MQDSKPLEHKDRSPEALKESQADLKAYLEANEPTIPLHTSSPAKQGIVITAGGQRLLINAAIVVKVVILTASMQHRVSYSVYAK